MAKVEQGSFSLLKDLTIIIPTARADHSRSFLFDVHRDQLYSVIVLNQAPDPLQSESHFIANNILWVNGPQSYHLRLLAASKYIKTKYVCMIGDDEFHFATGLLQSLRFLQSHPDYISCSGSPLRFSESLTLKFTNGEVIGFPVGPLLSAYDFESSFYDDPSDQRYISHFSRYQPRLIYSVTRAEIWINIWKLFNSATHVLPYRGSHEVFYESALSFYGISHLLPVPMWYRSDLFANLDNSASPDPYLNSSNPMLRDVFNTSSSSNMVNLKKQLQELCGTELGSWVFNSFRVYSTPKITLKSKLFSRITSRLNLLTMPRTYLHIFVRLLGFTVPDILLGRLLCRFSPSAFLQPFWHQSLAPIDRTQLLQYFRAISTKANSK